MRVHKLQNVQNALDYLTKVKRIKLVNIRNDEIVDGNPKLILGLLWTLILHFQVGVRACVCCLSLTYIHVVCCVFCMLHASDCMYMYVRVHACMHARHGRDVCVCMCAHTVVSDAGWKSPCHIITGAWPLIKQKLPTTYT